MIASEAGHIECVKVLLDKGELIFNKDKGLVLDFTTTPVTVTPRKEL